MTVLPILRDASAYSFFFDFDGTLTEIAETPGAVVVDERVREALDTLFQTVSGAVAIVTGREIEAIDQFIAPLKLPVAGVHGFERRNGETTVSATAAEESAAPFVEKVLSSFVSHNPGLLLEKKRGAIALHYRLRPELEALCLSLVEDLAAPAPGCGADAREDGRRNALARGDKRHGNKRFSSGRTLQRPASLFCRR